MTVKSGQMCWILILCVNVTSEFSYCLRRMKLSTGAGRSFIWDSGLLHSHPRLPCKYSSRIKRAPLASRPLADLTGPARTPLPATCLAQQYSGSLNRDIAEHTRGHLRVGPHFLGEKEKSMCGWLKWRYGPHGLPKGPSQRTRPS